MLPDVQQLAADIEASDPTDPGQQEALHVRIVRLREELTRANATDLAAYLDSASEVVQYLVHMGRMGPDQVLGIAAGLVRKVETSFELDLANAPIVGAARPAAPLPDTIGELASKVDPSTDERMLGEVMLQLGFVTRTQLEQGLVTQRATDQRIGEALIAIGAATWSQVKEAMAVQRRLRAAIPTTLRLQ